VQRKELGIAVVGSGRIGTLRARLAAKHPSVGFLAISDQDPARARALAEQTGADFHSGSNDEVISRPEVTAVFVSTPEGEHAAPVKKALELGKPVLVEKPLALTLADADDILDTWRKTGGNLRVGYSRRFKECFLRAKEQMIHKRLGRVVGGTARVYNSRAQAFSILKRSAHATPVLDVLTYYVDLMCWFLEGNPPVEVVARGQMGVFKEAGYDAHDVTWGIVTLRDGAVIGFLLDLFEHQWNDASPVEGCDTGYAEVAGDLQQTIAAMMARGFTDEVLARKLGMSLRTCRRHIAALMHDLDAVSRFQAGVRASRASLVDGT